MSLGKRKTLRREPGAVTDGAIVKNSPEDALHPGYTSLFNGKDFTGWVVPEGDNGHWKVFKGVIDYDAQSEAKGDKNLWTEKRVWRFYPEPGMADQTDHWLVQGTHRSGRWFRTERCEWRSDYG